MLVGRNVREDRSSVSARFSPEFSLEQIEDDFWGQPPSEATHLISTIYRLRGKPVGSLEAEDLRIMIGQNVGVDTLVPLALTRLTQEPLLEGDFYPGDVLTAVLQVSRGYWQAHPAHLQTVNEIISSIDDPGPPLDKEVERFRNRVMG